MVEDSPFNPVNQSLGWPCPPKSVALEWEEVRRVF
jgi:hypothetical protein